MVNTNSNKIKFYNNSVTAYKTIYGANSFHNLYIQELLKYNFKDYKNISQLTQLYNVIRPLTKFDLLFTQANGLVEIKGENILVANGTVLDLYTFEHLASVVYHIKYSKVLLLKTNYTNYYNNKCLELYLSSKVFDNPKLLKKLTPYIAALKTTILPHAELNKLYEEY